MDVEEVSWECIDWSDLAQEKDKWSVLVNMVLNQWVP